MVLLSLPPHLPVLPRSPPLPPPVAPSLFVAKVGSQARLECPHKPGALYNQYHGEWRNSSSVLLDVQKPSSSFDRRYIPDPRYSIDRESFSFVIDDVELCDSGSQYQCELMVENPQDDAIIHTYGPSSDLQLLVYSKLLNNVAVEVKCGKGSYRCSAIINAT